MGTRPCISALTDLPLPVSTGLTGAFHFQQLCLKPPLTARFYRRRRDSGTGPQGSPLYRGPGARLGPSHRCAGASPQPATTHHPLEQLYVIIVSWGD